jgi:hypothetical protein
MATTETTNSTTDTLSDTLEPGVMTNGPALAAVLGAAIGAFAMGLIVLLNEAGIFSVPALCAPAGGVSGRTTLAVVVWLIAWAVLHARWKDRDIGFRRVAGASLLLIALGMLGTYPPLWAVFS